MNILKELEFIRSIIHAGGPKGPAELTILIRHLQQLGASTKKLVEEVNSLREENSKLQAKLTKTTAELVKARTKKTTKKTSKPRKKIDSVD